MSKYPLEIVYVSLKQIRPEHDSLFNGILDNDLKKSGFSI